MNAGSDEGAPWADRIAVLLDLHRYVEAEVAARSRLTDEPADPRALGYLTQALLAQDRGKEALAIADLHVAAAPDSEWAHRQGAIAAASLDHWRTAVRHAEAAVRLAPEAVDAQLCAAVSYLGARKLDSARAHGQVARDLSPNTPEPLFVLALVSDRSNRPDEAEKLYRRALNLNPVDPLALHNLGVCLLRRGDVSSAQQLFTQSGRLDPSDPLARRSLVLSVRREVRLSSDNLAMAYVMRNGMMMLVALCFVALVEGSYAGAVDAGVVIGALMLLNYTVSRRRIARLPPLQRQLCRDDGWRSWRHPWPRFRQTLEGVRHRLPGFLIAAALALAYVGGVVHIHDVTLQFGLAAIGGVFFAPLGQRIYRQIERIVGEIKADLTRRP